jgi:hydrogenase-4 component F
MTTVSIQLLICGPVLIPLVAAAAVALLRRHDAVARVATLGAIGVLAVAILLATTVTRNGPVTGVFDLLAVDALSAFMLVVIGAVALIVGLVAPAHLRVEVAAGRLDEPGRTRHLVLVQLFLATMASAVLSASLGLLWVSLELTTVVTAFLVGQGRGRGPAEAAWKYVIICSTGIALALLGTFVLNAAAHHVGAGLDWVGLTAAAPELDPGVTRLAVLLLVVGFGTKAGLAPLHAWLPDAHSQAPAPVSALMSGVLISVAFYAVLRVKVVADLALGPDFARALLVVLALASIALAASLLIGQRDYKRMLAYSSIENMGLLALGAAIGSPLALAAVLLHILGHGLVKSSLFLGAGRLLQLTRTSRIAGVRALAAREPLLAWCFGLGILAIIAFPPFSLFASELGIVRAGFGGGLGWVTAAALLLVLVAAASLVGHTSRMLLGAPPAEPAGPPDAGGGGTAVGTRRITRIDATTVTMAIALTACALLGLALGPLTGLLDQAVAVAVGGTP